MTRGWGCEKGRLMLQACAPVSIRVHLLPSDTSVRHSGMACRLHKKKESQQQQQHGQGSGGPRNNNVGQSRDMVPVGEDNPNHLVYSKLETLVLQMQDEHSGLAVKTVKSFLSKIPSVFTGCDVIAWITKHFGLEDQAEALHIAHMISAYGYIFPIDDHVLSVKNDNTYFRFQTPCFWPSKCQEPENTDYAVYLCKRTMQDKQRLELADFEAENLARLQKMFSRRWEFIFLQAEAQAKVDKKRDKLERKVLDSQERAFWDVHRPVPGTVSTVEVDIKKACRMNKPLKKTQTNYVVPGGRISPSVSEDQLHRRADGLRAKIQDLRKAIVKPRVKVSKVAESFLQYVSQYQAYDPCLSTPDPSNPWVSDNLDFWEQEKAMKDIPQRRVKKWGFSINALLMDSAGQDHFMKFLEKEFSAENLKFWIAARALKGYPLSVVPSKVEEIYQQFLAPGAPEPINVDGRVAEAVKKRVADCKDRYCFDDAEEHIFKLMKSDSYTRYIRSEMYKEFLGGTRKKDSWGILRLTMTTLSKRRFPSRRELFVPPSLK